MRLGYKSTPPNLLQKDSCFGGQDSIPVLDMIPLLTVIKQPMPMAKTWAPVNFSVGLIRATLHS